MRWSKRRVVIAAVLSAVVVGAVVERAPLLQAAADVLVRDDGGSGAPADAIVLLMGDQTTVRAETTCRLYKAGRSEKVVFAEEARRGFVRLGLQKSAAQVHADFLAGCGVPRTAMIVLGDCATDSTVDEARCLHAYYAASGAMPARLLVVTSWYHSARAGWLFGRLFPEASVTVAAATGPDSTPVAWWHDKVSIFSVLSEYLKWGYWLTRPPSL